MLLITIFDYIGTVAFAISGALTGIKKQLDLFGIIFLSITTAVGGGIFRDLIIGNTPPVAFTKPIYCILSIASALLTCFFAKKIIKMHNIILIFDAIGLGVFTAIGSNTAISHNLTQPFIVISMGLITGIGGGILRDVFVKNIPLVFVKEIYAAASILGASCLYYSIKFTSIDTSLYICFFVTFILRILSIRHKLNLPTFNKKLEI